MSLLVLHCPPKDEDIRFANKIYLVRFDLIYFYLCLFIFYLFFFFFYLLFFFQDLFIGFNNYYIYQELKNQSIIYQLLKSVKNTFCMKLWIHTTSQRRFITGASEFKYIIYYILKPDSMRSQINQSGNLRKGSSIISVRFWAAKRESAFKPQNS